MVAHLASLAGAGVESRHVRPDACKSLGIERSGHVLVQFPSELFLSEQLFHDRSLQQGFELWNGPKVLFLPPVKH